MEPPSRQLLDLLKQYGLATTGDLRRCRPLVRRLSRDLPTFDSVWIDALTQTRTLTPFQAKLLQSDDPHRLSVGPCVLVDEWERHGRCRLYLARHQGTRRRCLLTHLDVPADQLPRARDAVRDLIARLRGWSHPSIVVPQGCDLLDGRLVVVNPYFSGPTLQQLLVRRGRFPIPVVAEITHQLVDALGKLETIGVVYGDLGLTSIRLNSRGNVVLPNPGVMPAAGSLVSFHNSFPSEVYDGTAPELISTGRTATFSSDLYALGCLVWQLLAGRPPFPTGDPLSKLAAHQTRPIDDVRRWRPDAPEELASLIARLTHKDPESRPAGSAEVSDACRLVPRSGRRTLARFHASFGVVAPRHGDSRRSAARFPWPAVAMLLFLLSGLSLSLLDAGARSELLRLADRLRESDRPGDLAKRSVETDPAIYRGSALTPLPSEPVDGVIELASSGPFSVTEIVTDRPLTIRASSDVTPVIAVTDQPLRLTTPSLRIQGVRFALADSRAIEVAGSRSGQGSPSFLVAASQQISLENCEFDGGTGDDLRSAVDWAIPDELDPNGGRFVAVDTLFGSTGGALGVRSVPRVIGFDNCLLRGNGALIRLEDAGTSTPLRVHLRKTTLRDSGAIIRWASGAASSSIQPTWMVVENSVIAPHDGAAALLAFDGPAPTGWERLLKITGEGSLLRTDAQLVSGPAGPVDTVSLRIEGLMTDDFEFAGDAIQPEASTVMATQIPRSSPTPPGIDPTRFRPQQRSPVVRRATEEYNPR